MSYFHMVYNRHMISAIGLFVILFVVFFVFTYISYPDRKKVKHMGIKVIYTFLLGIFVAVFVGVGIAAFYPELKYPEPPVALKYCSSEMIKGEEQYAEFKAEAEKFNTVENDYRVKSQIYNKNVSIISLIASILIVIASLTLFKKIYVIADGLLLGGVLTLIYSVIRGFGADDNMFRFIIVSIGLFISLFLGYIKFIKPAKT